MNSGTQHKGLWGTVLMIGIALVLCLLSPASHALTPAEEKLRDNAKAEVANIISAVAVKEFSNVAVKVPSLTFKDEVRVSKNGSKTNVRVPVLEDRTEKILNFNEVQTGLQQANEIFKSPDKLKTALNSGDNKFVPALAPFATNLPEDVDRGALQGTHPSTGKVLEKLPEVSKEGLIELSIGQATKNLETFSTGQRKELDERKESELKNFADAQKQSKEDIAKADLDDAARKALNDLNNQNNLANGLGSESGSGGGGSGSGSGGDSGKGGQEAKPPKLPDLASFTAPQAPTDPRGGNLDELLKAFSSEKPRGAVPYEFNPTMASLGEVPKPVSGPTSSTSDTLPTEKVPGTALTLSQTNPNTGVDLSASDGGGAPDNLGNGGGIRSPAGQQVNGGFDFNNLFNGKEGRSPTYNFQKDPGFGTSGGSEVDGGGAVATEGETGGAAGSNKPAKTAVFDYSTVFTTPVKKAVPRGIFDHKDEEFGALCVAERGKEVGLCKHSTVQKKTLRSGRVALQDA